MDRRELLGFLVAPPVAMAGFWGGAAAAATHDFGPLPPGALEHTLFFFMFFGVPTVYLGALLLGLPVYRGLRRHAALNGARIIVLSGALGSLWVFVLILVGGPPTRADAGFVAAAVLLGFLSGLLGGSVFALMTSSSRHLDQLANDR